MILLGLVAGLSTLLAAGVGATLLLMRGRPSVNLLECVALAWLFGGGIVSLLLWTGGLLMSGYASQLCVTGAAVALTVAGVSAARRARMSCFFPKPRNVTEWLLMSAIGLQFLFMLYRAFSHGLGWDGLLNWEVKARYAFFNGGVLPPAYYSSETHVITHPAYPLLIPMTELWLYLWMGEANQFWIKLIFPLYYIAAAILLVTAGRRLTNARWPGLVAAALFFFVPFLTTAPGCATGGYVDVPLSVFYLAAIAYLILFAVEREAYAWRIFALSVAFLPWLKREGTILWAISAACAALVIWQARAGKRAIASLLPGAVLIVAWQAFLHLMRTTETREFVPMSLVAFQANATRTIPICKMVIAEMATVSNWSLSWFGVALAFATLAWRARDSRFFLVAAAVATPIAAYAGTYLFSNWPDYRLHFEASFSRLLLHVMPVAWLAIAMALPWPTWKPAAVETEPQVHASRRRASLK
jgi:hypothetical protein